MPTKEESMERFLSEYKRCGCSIPVACYEAGISHMVMCRWIQNNTNGIRDKVEAAKREWVEQVRQVWEAQQERRRKERKRQAFRILGLALALLGAFVITCALVYLAF